MAADSEDLVILACTILIQSQSTYNGQTHRATDRHTHSKTDASTTAKMREALHTVAREKLCAILNFIHFDSLVCIVTRSREKSRSLSFALTYRSMY